MEASANDRLAKVEATVSVLQVQVADIRKTLVDIQRTQVACKSSSPSEAQGSVMENS